MNLLEKKFVIFVKSSLFVDLYVIVGSGWFSSFDCIRHICMALVFFWEILKTFASDHVATLSSAACKLFWARSIW
jgi:hypothetical protein